MLWNITNSVLILSIERSSLSIFLSQHLMHVINCRGSTPYAGLTTSVSTDSKTYTLLTSIHNDADDADTTDKYNTVIGITHLKTFSCAKNVQVLYSSRKWASFVRHA